MASAKGKEKELTAMDTEFGCGENELGCGRDEPGCGEAGSSEPGCGEDATELPHVHHMAWYQLLRAHSAVNREVERKLDKVSKPATLGWYDVLVTLEKSPCGRLRMSELADNVMLSDSGLTRLVDKLEAAGLLRRDTCPGDRRVCFAAITEAGLEWRRAAWPARRAMIAELFARHISEEEARTLVVALGRVADAAAKSK